jgi:hypothetical protein
MTDTHPPCSTTTEEKLRDALDDMLAAAAQAIHACGPLAHAAEEATDDDRAAIRMLIDATARTKELQDPWSASMHRELSRQLDAAAKDRELRLEAERLARVAHEALTTLLGGIRRSLEVVDSSTDPPVVIVDLKGLRPAIIEAERVEGQLIQGLARMPRAPLRG